MVLGEVPFSAVKTTHEDHNFVVKSMSITAGIKQDYAN